MTDKRAQGIAEALRDGMQNGSRPYYKRHDGDEFCDEIRFKVVPRFKTSGLSGDEWRTNVRVELLRKGAVYATKTFSTMKYAIMMLGAFYVEAHEPVPKEAVEREKTKCDQPGCSEDAVNHYRKNERSVEVCSNECAAKMLMRWADEIMPGPPFSILEDK